MPRAWRPCTSSAPTSMPRAPCARCGSGEPRPSSPLPPSFAPSTSALSSLRSTSGRATAMAANAERRERARTESLEPPLPLPLAPTPSPTSAVPPAPLLQLEPPPQRCRRWSHGHRATYSRGQRALGRCGASCWHLRLCAGSSVLPRHSSPPASLLRPAPVTPPLPPLFCPGEGLHAQI